MPTNLSSLPCVDPTTSQDPQRVGDQVIAHYRGRHLSDLQRDLGHPIDLGAEIEVVGGLGVLVLRWTGNTYSPDLQERPPEDSHPEPTADQVAARRATCQACPGDMYEPGPDRCRMCGCGGIMAQRTASRWATCPRGYWHA